MKLLKMKLNTGLCELDADISIDFFHVNLFI